MSPRMLSAVSFVIIAFIIDYGSAGTCSPQPSADITSGVIRNPFNATDATYAPGDSCAWLVHAPAGYFPRVIFTEFTIACGDSITLYDGDSADEKAALKVFTCDRHSWPELLHGYDAPWHDMYIAFHAASVVGAAGFSFNYSYEPYPEPPAAPPTVPDSASPAYVGATVVGIILVLCVAAVVCYVRPRKTERWRTETPAYRGSRAGRRGGDPLQRLAVSRRNGTWRPSASVIPGDSAQTPDCQPPAYEGNDGDVETDAPPPYEEQSAAGAVGMRAAPQLVAAPRSETMIV